MATEKLFCYVDETGQDAAAACFIVSVVITASNRDQLLEDLERIERTSKKGNVKWRAAAPAVRLAYIRGVLASPDFKGTLRYATYRNVTNYFGPTVLTVARTVTLLGLPDYKVTVFMDGLPRSLAKRFGTQLRQLGIRTEKVRGVRREETNSLIRLADALCGFVRAALEGHPALAPLLARATEEGVIAEL